MGWESIYYDTLVDVSDERLKKDIVPMDPAAATQFITLLEPVTARWRKPKHEMVPDPALAGKTMSVEVEDTTRHNWFIAQNVKAALQTVNGVWGGQSIAKGVLLHEEVDGQERLGLSYKEFTPILTSALKTALAKIAELEARIAALEQSSRFLEAE
jgi:hypothetical protein